MEEEVLLVATPENETGMIAILDKTPAMAKNYHLPDVICTQTIY